ncbi:MAG: 3-oxoacyl-ACP reductase FabG [Bacteroidota bacterium]
MQAPDARTGSRLEGRVAVVTGGSRGIGYATAIRFGQEGAQLVLADINADTGEASAQALRDLGYDALFVQTNVVEPEQTQAMAQAALDAYGRIDILVNNAGVTRDATLKKMSEEAFDFVIDVNLKGVFNATQAVIPAMIEQGHGRILNAASVVALYGNFGQTNYAATKAGVVGMTKTWARELGRKGITVNAVAPGFIQTDMIGSVPDKVLDMFVDKTPMARLGQPGDIANAYLFLASDEAGFVTGTVLSVDGGLVL